MAPARSIRLAIRPALVLALFDLAVGFVWLGTGNAAALVVARQRHMPPQSGSVVSGLHALFLLNNAALDRKGRDHGRPRGRSAAAQAPPRDDSGWRMPGRIYIRGGTPPGNWNIAKMKASATLEDHL